MSDPPLTPPYIRLIQLLDQLIYTGPGAALTQDNQDKRLQNSFLTKTNALLKTKFHLWIKPICFDAKAEFFHTKSQPSRYK